MRAIAAAGTIALAVAAALLAAIHDRGQEPWLAGAGRKTELAVEAGVLASVGPSRTAAARESTGGAPEAGPPAASKEQLWSMVRDSGRIALSYYERDKAFLRKAFMGGWSSPMQGSELAELFRFDDGLDPEELAVLVDAETVEEAEKLAYLADLYLASFEAALRDAIARGPERADSIEDEPRSDVFHRIDVEVNGIGYVYRLRKSDYLDVADLFSQRAPLVVARFVKAQKALGQYSRLAQLRTEDSQASFHAALPDDP